MSGAAPAAPEMDVATALLADLAARTRVGRGIVRDTYGAGEQAAHDLARQAADAIKLACRVDALGNLFMTLPGHDRGAARVLIGSHLDSVNQGGNYDGAAGVAAGLAVLAGLARTGQRPRRDMTVMAIRGEESAWFDVPYIGSAGAFGLLDPVCLGVRRSDGAATLGEALRAGGFDPQAVRERRRLLDPASIAAYLELHIEQGPVLVAADVAACAVTGIRGCLRFRNAVCRGAYGHSGALPRAFRRDAVAATVALLHELEAEWLRREAAGEDLTVTSGELFTDPAQHGPSKVAGETRFVLDLRSISEATMAQMADHASDAAARIGAAYRVAFDLGAASHSSAAPMDAGLRAMLRARLGAFEMASGAGHDAAVFAGQGIRCAVVFVRNENGSHNPDEAMAPADFAVGTQALAHVAWELAEA